MRRSIWIKYILIALAAAMLLSLFACDSTTNEETTAPATNAETEKPTDEFEEAALLSELTDTEIPQPIAALQGKPVRFSNLCAAEEMPNFVRKTVGV